MQYHNAFIFTLSNELEFKTILDEQDSSGRLVGWWALCTSGAVYDLICLNTSFDLFPDLFAANDVMANKVHGHLMAQ